MSRPTCAHCGAAYGQRHTRDHVIRWSTPTTTYTILEADWTRPGTPAVPVVLHRLSGEACAPPPYRGNERVIERTKPWFEINSGQMRQTLTLWDGESWRGGYDPFCTMRCALNYARQAMKKFGKVA